MKMLETSTPVQPEDGANAIRTLSMDAVEPAVAETVRSLPAGVGRKRLTV